MKKQSIKERRSLRAPLGAPLAKVRARARPPLQKIFDERERERRSKNRRALQLSAARSIEAGRSWNFINILVKIRHF